MTDSYVCWTNVFGFSTENEKSIQNPNLSSVMRTVPHDDNFPVLKLPVTWILDEADENVTAQMWKTLILMLNPLFVIIPGNITTRLGWPDQGLGSVKT